MADEALFELILPEVDDGVVAEALELEDGEVVAALLEVIVSDEVEFG